ncbi:MAG TPA: PEP/pyruvate-binding domain-containing protein [Candidatus Cloacimonadota bacterium]|nr:PEP/pyruvate-binding domain-containing protein [Candidatus Cloacimonadota bacterium]
MIKSIDSKALEQNLLLTRKKEIVIPPEDIAFLSQCEAVFGIHKRLNAFLKELYHPYPNNEFIIKSLRQIVLEDYHFYFNDSIFEQSQSRFIRYFEILIENNKSKYKLSTPVTESVIHTLISYTPLILKVNHPQRDSFIQKFSEILKVFAMESPNSFCSNIKSFYSNWSDLLDNDILFVWVKNVVMKNLSFWLQHTDLLNWYKHNLNIFKNDYTQLFEEIGQVYLQNLLKETQECSSFTELQKIPSQNEIATTFRNYTSLLHSPFEQIYFLIYLLNHPAMQSLYRHLIYDLDKAIRTIDTSSNIQDLLDFLENIFTLFEKLRKQFSDSMPDSLASLGKAIIRFNIPEITDLFIKKLLRFGFEFVEHVEVSEDWQLIYNPKHILYIRLYLEIYMSSPESCKSVLSALIAYLKLGGIFISDTDLFQKDISKLLNSPIQNHFKLLKQLCRIFPVYFNEIGAEGELRECSTKLDELTNTRDIIIHFLRKQIHTESNNTHIDLCARIIDFWDVLEFNVLTGSYPNHVVSQADITEEDRNTHALLQHIKEKYNLTAREVLLISKDKISAIESMDFSEISRSRIVLLIKIFQLLRMKYAFDSTELITHLKKYVFFSNKEIKDLSFALNKNDYVHTLSLTINMLQKLKRVILQKEKSEGREEIYYKRHIAAGIPSMYGRYFESKFDALGLSLRLEQTTAALIQKMIEKLPLEYVTAGTLKRILRILEIINEGLSADGIENESFASNINMLKYSLTSETFSMEQYKNILKFMQDNVREIINEFFFRNFDPVLKEIMPSFFKKQTDETDYKLFYHKKSEFFYRELLSSAFIIQTLDNFIAKIIDAINTMQDTLPENIINLVMHYDAEKLVTHLDEKSTRLDNQAFLGAKAYFLKQLIKRNIPVPNGFVFSTELFRYREATLKHQAISRDIDNLIKRNIHILEQKTRQRFGNFENPLLLSVRSGAPLSMPGAMNTFLNIGMNDELTEALGQHHNFRWTAWDCYRRLIQSWGMAFGVDRDLFDQVILDFKKKCSVDLKTQFTPRQMRDIAYAYKNVLNENNVYLEQDLYKQVRVAVRNVIKSWDSDRAILYRKQMEIANEWGTAVIIQKMAFGNIGLNAGSGVLFTHNPFLKSSGINLYGDYTLCSQGEDIVGGLVNTLPISKSQTNTHTEEELEMSLEVKFPHIYNKLLHYAHVLLENYTFNHQEIEFTFESPAASDLYILQTRNQAIQKQQRLLRFKNVLKQKAISHGTGIGQNVLNGKVAFNMNDLIELNKQYPNTPRILIRPDTVPDDMPMIFESEGLITARGGVSSHAAVTAARLGKTGIVNCRNLKVNDKEKTCYFDNICIKAGDNLAIDPLTGSIWNTHFETIQSDAPISII